MTKRQLVKWLEAKQSDAKAEVEIQYATAEKAYFAQRDEALKINETVDEVFRLISEADTVANRWKEALEKLGFDLSALIEADNHPVTTALTVEVDTKFLFIGGEKK